MNSLIKNKKQSILWISGIYLICISLRFFEYFFIRTDSSFLGEAVFHKLAGIIILFSVLKILSVKITEINFSAENVSQNIFRGLCIGIFCYAISYAFEVRLLKDSSTFQYVDVYVTAYSVNGNSGNHKELIFFLICFAGNLINVMMEEGVFRGLFQKILEEKYSFMISAVIASVLFGIWHCVAPIRSFYDGEISQVQMIISLIILIGSSTLVGLKYSLLTKITNSIIPAMADHFVNNTVINLIHVVSLNGTDQFQTIRISIAQTISFIIILVIYMTKKNFEKNKKDEVKNQLELQLI